MIFSSSQKNKSVIKWCWRIMRGPASGREVPGNFQLPRETGLGFNGLGFIGVQGIIDRDGFRVQRFRV